MKNCLNCPHAYYCWEENSNYCYRDKEKVVKEDGKHL
jgi:hypothetical protein